MSAPDAGDTISFTHKEKLMIQGIARDLQALQNNGNTNSANITGKDARGNSNNVIANNNTGNVNSNGSGTNPGNHYAYGHYKYPSLSPYAFVANNPVLFHDPDGQRHALFYFSIIDDRF